MLVTELFYINGLISRLYKTIPMVLRNPVFLKSKRNRLIFSHILVWSIFIAYEISFVYITAHVLQSFMSYVYSYSKNILLFYVNVWCLNYSFAKKKNKYLYALLLLAQLGVYIGVSSVINDVVTGFKSPIIGFLSGKLILQYVYRAIYFIGISAGYWFVLLLLRSNDLINKMQSRHLIQQKRSAELERNLFKAKNAYLTSQINPHLLFNTLNFIYSNMYEVSKKAAEIVVLLSDMMRYSLTEIGDDGQVELSKEVEHIENMVQLNQARFNDKLNVKMHLDGDFEVRVIPLVFLTFIENVFKHGDLTDPEKPARIHITCFNNILEFYCTNKVRKVNINKGGGIGIENSKTRLEMAYPDKFQLATEVADDQYITRLIINFN